MNQWGGIGSIPGKFNQPWYLATDATANVYVSDSYNSRVQVFPAGNLTTPSMVIGSYGSGGNGYFYEPGPVAVAPNGNIYVVDVSTLLIQIFSPSGSFISQWGGTSGYYGNGTFSQPLGIAVAANGSVYITDPFTNLVQAFPPGGASTPITQWGVAGFGGYLLHGPEGIAIDRNSGHIYIAEDLNGTVKVYDQNNTYVTTWSGFSQPCCVAVGPCGNVFITDNSNSMIYERTSAGSPVTQWGGSGTGNGKFNVPGNLATDPNNGYVYVSDLYDYLVQEFKP